MKPIVLTAILLIAARSANVSPSVAPATTFSYADYAVLLKATVDDDGWVDYSAIKADGRALEGYLNALASLEQSTFQTWNEHKKLAFWINAYNGLTLELIADHYPIKSGFLKSLLYPSNSIRQIPGAWDRLTFDVMGEQLTLDHIEHAILRAEFKDPRIHAALVCAAVSCPPLRNEPYQGETINEQLEDQTKAFLARPDGLRVDRAEGEVWVSAIFDWFAGDFVRGFGEPRRGRLNERHSSIVNFILPHAEQVEAAFLAEGAYELKHFDYDWSLNERRP
jgi:hypothetical protein